MLQKLHGKYIHKSKFIYYVIGIVSFIFLVISSYILLRYSNEISNSLMVFLLLLSQLSGGFFFAVTVSQVIEWVTETDNATILWKFNSECANAGLKTFYSSRDGQAKTDLENKFNNHRKGNIYITGASLRLFFAPGTTFWKIIDKNIVNYNRHDVKIFAVICDIDSNISTPIRSFVEEFNPDGTPHGGKKRKKFEFETQNYFVEENIRQEVDFDLKAFSANFYEKYGKNSGEHQCRCVTDLINVKKGIEGFNAKEEITFARKTVCAPYFTAVIFPDICYYTPNMLYPDVPVNMPTHSFVSGGPVYNKILTHFKFLWWSGKNL